MNRDCPVCGKITFDFYCGTIDPGGNRIDPDYGECSLCGFIYSEDIRRQMKDQVDEYMKSDKYLEAKP